MERKEKKRGRREQLRETYRGMKDEKEIEKGERKERGEREQ